MSFAVILIHQHPEVLDRYTCVCVCKGADLVHILYVGMLNPLNNFYLV